MDKLDTPATFLSDLGERLKGKEGADLDVTKILTAHVLKCGASDRAAHLAKEALLILAAGRATAMKKGDARE